MSFNVNAVNDHLTRGEIWDQQLKERLEDTLMGTQYVKWVDFKDGATLTIPSIGGATVRTYSDDESIKYDKFDTGEFQMSGFDYVSSATYITDQAKMDSMYANQLISRFVPEMQLALEKKLETDIFSSMDENQTASNANDINGVSHRFKSEETGDVFGVKMLVDAKFALQKANVPLTNLIAIVDPSAAYTLENNLSGTAAQTTRHDPIWESVIANGGTTGMRFVTSLFGFDIYTSNYLPSTGTTETFTEADGATGSGTMTAGVKNYFFSAASPDLLNTVGAWRQPPRVESSRNKDKQRDEYLVTSRYLIQGGYRPENLVVGVTETSVQ